MLNRDRIILMTKMATYEKHEGKKYMDIGRYFRADYMSVQIVKSLVLVTVAFILGLALYVLADFSTLMAGIYEMDLLAFGREILNKYIWVLVIYCAFIYVFYTCRYIKARKSLKGYYYNLKKMNSLYNKAGTHTED